VNSFFIGCGLREYIAGKDFAPQIILVLGDYVGLESREERKIVRLNGGNLLGL
jgi:hypothetical protein